MSIKKIGIVLGCLLVFALFVWVSVNEIERWDKFSKEHNCKIVSKTSGTVSTTSGLIAGSTTQIVTVNTYIPGKTSYLCDDGVVYER
jgi:hypothetical protein